MTELPFTAVPEEKVVFLADSLCLLVNWMASQPPGQEVVLANQVESHLLVPDIPSVPPGVLVFFQDLRVKAGFGKDESRLRTVNLDIDNDFRRSCLFLQYCFPPDEIGSLI